MSDHIKHTNRAQNVKKQAYQVPTLRPQAKEMIFKREHYSKKWSVIRKRRWRIQRSRLITEGPHVCRKRLLKVIPGTNILVLYDLVGVIEDELTT